MLKSFDLHHIEKHFLYRFRLFLRHDRALHDLYAELGLLKAHRHCLSLFEGFLC